MKNLTTRMARGFTLVELIVVISIIVLLTGIILTNLNPAKAKARDSKRTSDLSQIQLALELYFDRCKEYPATLDLAVHNGGDCTATGITFGTYIGQLPTLPGGGSYDYLGNDGTHPTDYVLHVTLENTFSDIQRDGISDATLKTDMDNSWAYDPTWYCYDPATPPARPGNINGKLEYCISPR